MEKTREYYINKLKNEDLTEIGTWIQVPICITEEERIEIFNYRTLKSQQFVKSDCSQIMTF